MPCASLWLGNYFVWCNVQNLHTPPSGIEAHSSGPSEHPCAWPSRAIFDSLWGCAKFEFGIKYTGVKGPLRNGAASLHRKRKIRGNQLLPLYSISHLSLLLDTLCCLPRGAIHQSLGKMTHGRKQCQYTKTMGKTPAHCQVKYNRKCFRLRFDRVQKKNNETETTAEVNANLSARLQFIGGHISDPEWNAPQ